MKRRHILALLILVLVVATVLAFGPARVWDALTLRTVEEYEHGRLSCRFRVRRWRPSDTQHAVGIMEFWQAAGHVRQAHYPAEGAGFNREWKDGTLIAYSRWMDCDRIAGVEASINARGEVVAHFRFVGGRRVEHRTSPPWFTEEEILQAVEGVEE